MINVVIPMAGAGSRFQKVGYKKPKPFIEVLGEPMILHVMNSLGLKDAKYILIARAEHVEQEPEAVAEITKKYNAQFVTVDKLTEGAACTVLSVHRLINNDVPLLMLNSDQVVDYSLQKFVDACLNQDLDGSILTFREPGRDPKWSYVKIREDGLVEQAKEKVALSDQATVGVYLFSKGRYYVESAIDMIVANDRTNNEFYVAPVYNYLINKGGRVSAYDIPVETMHGIGTPEDLNAYLELRTK